MKSFPRLLPSEDQISCLKSSAPDVTAVVSAEVLLVPCDSDGGFAPCFFDEEGIGYPRFSLTLFIES